MQEVNRYVDQAPNHLDGMMADLGGLTAQQIEAANRVATDLSTRAFMFHAWANLPNTNVGGVMGNLVPYPVLKRMQLLPVYAWVYDELVDKPIGTGQEIDTAIVTGKVQIGSRSKRRTQSVETSVAYIKTMFGKMSGIRVIECLTTRDDEGAREAFMLFHAAMETRRDKSIKNDPRFGLRGVDVLMQDLVDRHEDGDVVEGFLSIAAPVALRYALARGLRVPDNLRNSTLFLASSKDEVDPDGIYHFRETAPSKGTAMISELSLVCNAAVQLATGPNGVLVNSRNQIQAARNHQPDTKMQKDPLDIWLSMQNPDFSWDTEVDRMKAANQPLLEEMRRFGGVGQAVNHDELNRLREQNAALLAERAETNARLARIEASLQPALPSKPATGSRGAARATTAATDTGSNGEGSPS